MQLPVGLIAQFIDIALVRYSRVGTLWYLTSSYRNKALFSHGKPRPEANSVRGFPCKNKAFYFP